MRGGYYRVDLTDELSVLALNTLYFDSDRSKHSDISQGIFEIELEQLEWIREQFHTEDEINSARKFILISHVYPGARYKDF